MANIQNDMRIKLMENKYDKSLQSIMDENTPTIIGPYVQAMIYGDLVFISGQIAIDPATGKIPSDIESQVRQAIKNAEIVLKQAGSSLKRAIKVNIYMTDLDDFPVINRVYQEMFTVSYPARSCMEVSRLPGGANFEIDIVAAK
ncbi:RidA family protein [Pectinatus haikarae]|uniref:2-iminobutanoate/2-iminopropanoate deaminase n=1 Tax=Pectinatus haikarae TaxID=349096 RepID=A0ABT9YBE2_9FIRM|nr:Rid family detoxifying hydrolase [Pectinatus haikarae]MDQ0204810.1 2-iminobutanoate/2-iminopropanoate deaminase [Pectinatus haikarae]